MFRKLVFLVFLLIASVVGATVLITLMNRNRQVQVAVHAPVPPTPRPTATPPTTINVYVTGAVNRPQTTVQIPYRGRVQDALDAAGGTTANADMNGINPAAILSDGDHVHVPPARSAPASTPTAPHATAPINVNTADSEQLQTLPRIGAALAQRILDYREANGAFNSLEDLGKVSGIGAATLEGLRDRVVFE